MADKTTHEFGVTNYPVVANVKRTVKYGAGDRFTGTFFSDNSVFRFREGSENMSAYITMRIDFPYDQASTRLYQSHCFQAPAHLDLSSSTVENYNPDEMNPREFRIEGQTLLEQVTLGSGNPFMDSDSKIFIYYCSLLTQINDLTSITNPGNVTEWYFSGNKFGATMLETLVQFITDYASTGFLTISGQVANGGDYPNANTLSLIDDLETGGWTVYYDEA